MKGLIVEDFLCEEQDLDIQSLTGSQCREAQSSNMMSPSSCLVLQHLGPTGGFPQTYWDVLIMKNHSDPVQREQMHGLVPQASLVNKDSD